MAIPNCDKRLPGCMERCTAPVWKNSAGQTWNRGKSQERPRHLPAKTKIGPRIQKFGRKNQKPNTLLENPGVGSHPGLVPTTPERTLFLYGLQTWIGPDGILTTPVPAETKRTAAT